MGKRVAEIACASSAVCAILLYLFIRIPYLCSKICSKLGISSERLRNSSLPAAMLWVAVIPLLTMIVLFLEDWF